MKILTRRELEKHNRQLHTMRQDIRQVNADRASMASDLRTCRRWLDGWRDRALRAEKTCKLLADENARLRRCMMRQGVDLVKRTKERT